MVYTKDHPDFPNVGTYFAFRDIHADGSKGDWTEPFGMITPFLEDPKCECVMYDRMEDLQGL